jgi:hypothetical protein
MKTIKLTSIKPNPNNPRYITEAKFEALKRSIRDFPEMMALRPMVVDEQGMVLGGNMRLKALSELGYEDIPAAWVIKAKDLTEEQRQEFLIKDNVGFGAWDWDMLGNDWQAEMLIDWGLDVPAFSNSDTLQKVNSTDTEWVGMPEFEAKENSYKIIIHFDTDDERHEYAKERNMQFRTQGGRTWTTWHPFRERDDLRSLQYGDDDNEPE